MLFSSLHPHHVAKSEDSLNSLRAKLCRLAHDYCEIRPTWPNSPFQRDHYDALRSLRTNKDIVIVKADKGGTCVILDKSDYVSKMESILSDESKFTKLGPADKFDNTKKIERNFQKYLLSLKKENLVSNAIVDSIRPSGSQRSRMYGLPKVHKEDVPLRPILSTVKSSQRPVAECLKKILQPVYEKFSRYCVTDSFKFADEMKTMKYSDFPDCYMTSRACSLIFLYMMLSKFVLIPFMMMMMMILIHHRFRKMFLSSC